MAKSHTFSLPNLITYGRILAVPGLAVFVIFTNDEASKNYIPELTAKWIAVTVFIIAGVSDFFDGYLARIWKQQTTLGRLLDPIADKLLVAVCLLLLVYTEEITSWSIVAAVIILCREILVSGLREFLAELRVSVPVTKLAKVKTFLQMLSIGILLSGPAADQVFIGLAEFGLILFWISAILTIYTGYDYFKAGINYIMDDTEK